MEPFEDRKHLVYYNPDDPEEIARLVNYYLANPTERDAIAAAGRAEVLQKHAMRLPMRKILDDAEKSGTTAADIDPWEAAISKLAKV
jgi:spore maturation protein CgeB